MGYSTEFNGTFNVVDLKREYSYLPRNLEKAIKAHYLNEEWRKPKSQRKSPDSYCQWQLVEGGDGHDIIWDGGEKFYYYREWLQYFLDTYLIPNSYTLEGKVRYQGEELDDCGFIYVEHGKVVTQKLENFTSKPITLSHEHEMQLEIDRLKERVRLQSEIIETMNGLIKLLKKEKEAGND